MDRAAPNVFASLLTTGLLFIFLVYTLLFPNPFWTTMGVWAFALSFYHTLDVVLHGNSLYLSSSALVLPMAFNMVGGLLNISHWDVFMVLSAVVGVWLSFMLSFTTLAWASILTDLRAGPTSMLLMSSLLTLLTGCLVGLGFFYSDALLGTSFLGGNTDLMIWLLLYLFGSLVMAVLLRTSRITVRTLDSRARRVKS